MFSLKKLLNGRFSEKPILLSICIKKYIKSSNFFYPYLEHFSKFLSFQILHKFLKKMFQLNKIFSALLLLNQSFLLPNGRREVLGWSKSRRELFSIPEQSGGVVGERSEGQPDYIISFLLLCLLRRAFFRLRSRRSTPLAPSAAPHKTSPGQKWARVFSTPYPQKQTNQNLCVYLSETKTDL